MILCILYKVHDFSKESILQGTHYRRTGSPEHPKENNQIIAYMR